MPVICKSLIKKLIKENLYREISKDKLVFDRVHKTLNSKTFTLP